MALHGVESHGGLAALLGSWTWDPLVILGVAASAVVYARGVRRLWAHGGRGHGVRVWQAASMVLGLASAVIALLSPLDGLADVLFTAHMSQHAVLMLIAAPLCVFGRPMIAALWALPASRRGGAGRFFQLPPVRRGWRFASHPATVLVVHAVAIWVWHVPAMFEAALRSEAVHTVQHLCFFVTAALFWWAIVHGRYGRVGYGLAVAFVFVTGLHSSLLGALLAVAGHVWYPLQSERAAAWGLTPIEDQQLAGLVMWVPSGVIFLLLGLALFAAWLGEAERRTARREAVSS